MMIGETMFVSGVVMFFSAPLVGRLMLKIDMRLMIALGLVLFAAGTWQMTWVTRDYDFWELFIPQVFRGTGMMLAMVPVNNIALGTLPPAMMKNASGLFNLTRNLGGAVGLALINTILNDRTDHHISRLHDTVNWGNATAVDTLNMLTQKFQGLGDASLMALKELSLIVHRQASVMSYADTFFILTVFYLTLSTLVFFVDRPAMAGGPSEAH
jgi:DHA2 family multidrug resistance protein